MSTGETSSSSPARRRRVAAGPRRPRYLVERDLDRMMIMLVTLMGEVSALRDRLDTHEALADAGEAGKTAMVEAYQVEEQRLLRREETRMAMVRRVFRVLMEELEGGKSAGGSALAKILESESAELPEGTSGKAGEARPEARHDPKSGDRSTRRA